MCDIPGYAEVTVRLERKVEFSSLDELSVTMAKVLGVPEDDVSKMYHPFLSAAREDHVEYTVIVKEDTARTLLAGGHPNVVSIYFNEPDNRVPPTTAFGSKRPQGPGL